MKITFERALEVLEAMGYELEQPEQEPVCIDWDTKTDEPIIGYAAPVRTKDLTDDEIAAVCVDIPFTVKSTKYDLAVARAVIAADREKNK